MNLSEMIAARTLESITITCDKCVTRGTGEYPNIRRIAAHHATTHLGHTVTEVAGYDKSVIVSDKVWAKRRNLA